MPSVNSLLPRRFYQRPTADVAKDLIGNELVRRISTGDQSCIILSGTIIETEAYGFDDDEASHAFRGHTKRNSVMFGPVGTAYVYFTYGSHYCVNVTARDSARNAGAVLIRSIRPNQGLEEMRLFRKKRDGYDLASGPGKLTQSMNISLAHNGVDMTDASSELWIRRSIRGPQPVVKASCRIGISRACDKQWRFTDVCSAPFLSRKPGS